MRRVVYAASSSAYGDTPTLPKVETMSPAPLSPYAVAKLAGEHYCAVFAGAYGLETVSLRYFNVFGARQDPKSEYAAVIPRFVTAGLAGKGVTIFGDGTQSRDFCYIDNTVEANMAAASAPAGGRVRARVQRRMRRRDDTERRRAAHRRGIWARRSRSPTRPARVGDVKHSLADISAARSQLGYSGAISFAEGLRRTDRLVRGTPRLSHTPLRRRYSAVPAISTTSRPTTNNVSRQRQCTRQSGSWRATTAWMAPASPIMIHSDM